LTEARLVGADLTGADLSHANLSRAILCGANLSGADLRFAFFSDTDLRGAALEGARLHWRSRELLCAVLRPHAEGDRDKERWLAWIGSRWDVCWDRLDEELPADVLEWGLSRLLPYVREDDTLPCPLHRYREKHGDRATNTSRDPLLSG